MKQEFRRIPLAFGFLTIFPLGNREVTLEDLGKSVAYFPLVGLALGLILWGVDTLLGEILPYPAQNALILALLLLLSGGMHVDGLIDTFDGVGVHSSRERRLEVMSDSRAGSYGVLGVVILFILEYAFLSSLDEDLRMKALVLSPMLSRAAMVYAMASFPPAKGEGMGAAFKREVTIRRAAFAFVFSLIVAAALGWRGILCMAGVMAFTVGLSLFLRRRLGGLTGDNYGAINELSQMIALLGMVI